jgi:hypothetical protein
MSHEGEYGGCILYSYMNICPKSGERGRENDRGVNLRCILRTYINITMYHPVQLLCANKQINITSSSKKTTL